MAKIKIQKPERGEQPEGGWYFTSYRLPLTLAQKLDRISQKETKEQGTNISFSTTTIRLLEHAIKEYGPTPGFKSELEATVIKKAASAGKKVAKAEKKVVTAKAAKKAEKKVEKKAAKKAAAKGGKGLQVKSLGAKKVKAAPVEEEVEVEVAEASAEETEEEVELSD